MGTHPIFESDFDCLTEGMSVANNDNDEWWQIEYLLPDEKSGTSMPTCDDNTTENQPSKHDTIQYREEVKVDDGVLNTDDSGINTIHNFNTTVPSVEPTTYRGNVQTPGTSRSGNQSNRHRGTRVDRKNWGPSAMPTPEERRPGPKPKQRDNQLTESELQTRNRIREQNKNAQQRRRDKIKAKRVEQARGLANSPDLVARNQELEQRNQQLEIENQNLAARVQSQNQQNTNGHPAACCHQCSRKVQELEQKLNSLSQIVLGQHGQMITPSCQTVNQTGNITQNVQAMNCFSGDQGQMINSSSQMVNQNDNFIQNGYDMTSRQMVGQNGNNIQNGQVMNPGSKGQMIQGISGQMTVSSSSQMTDLNAQGNNSVTRGQMQGQNTQITSSQIVQNGNTFQNGQSDHFMTSGQMFGQNSNNIQNSQNLNWSSNRQMKQGNGDQMIYPPSSQMTDLTVQGISSLSTRQMIQSQNCSITSSQVVNQNANIIQNGQSDHFLTP